MRAVVMNLILGILELGLFAMAVAVAYVLWKGI